MLVKSLLVDPACELLFVFLLVKSLLVNSACESIVPKTNYACEFCLSILLLILLVNPACELCL